MKATIKILSCALLLQNIIAMEELPQENTEEFRKLAKKYYAYGVPRCLGGLSNLWPRLKTVEERKIVIAQWLAIIQDPKENEIMHTNAAKEILSNIKESDIDYNPRYREIAQNALEEIRINRWFKTALDSTKNDEMRCLGALHVLKEGSPDHNDRETILDVLRHIASNQQANVKDCIDARKLLLKHGKEDDKNGASAALIDIVSAQQTEAKARRHATWVLLEYGPVDNKQQISQMLRNVAIDSAIDQRGREGVTLYLFYYGTEDDRTFASPLLEEEANAAEESFLKTHMETGSESDWGKHLREFRTAFNEGDIETLERLKIEHNIQGLSDHCGRFGYKYGNRMETWKFLLEDALKNKK